MILFGAIYAVVAWVVHNEMHRDKKTFFAKTAFFRYLEWRHNQHHLNPRTNFNVLLPLWDWVFGTYVVVQRARA